MKTLLILTFSIFLSLSVAAQENYLAMAGLPAAWSSLNIHLEEDSMLIFSQVQELPEFPGGEEAMMQFIQENVAYPEIARGHAHEGTVVVEFVVHADGHVGEAKVLKTVGLGCDEAALAVFEEMPNWKPAFQDGRAVPVRYITPVKFRLF